ncbi:GroEL equatorial domain-like protein [Exidia glandulosa HHB12029]|uniref:GroEL equatorial domain-like protein n=1 Tax=Exidia glandulosa HHB12029 TaxID=1314781 RepID=A0A166NA16_EXIGL|nr:GroEL equatorial domain-like protein [Exidia glandulosa HHB12029]
MARLTSFVGAMAVGDLVKSTLGPKGMNKILQSASGDGINVTNDGATILKSIHLDNAAAKILVNISKVQDDEVGDGTTSVCVLASELLREAEKLVMAKIHPQTIVEGFRIASYDSSDLVTRLRAAHYDGKADFGLDMNNATIESMHKLGVTESYKQVIVSASEAGQLYVALVRIDCLPELVWFAVRHSEKAG